MKKTLLTHLFILMAMTILHAQIKPAITGPQITFESTVHNFGIIPYMGNGSYVYTFSNTGVKVLSIINVIKGCGCTTIDWTKDSIKPGEKGMIKATYDTRKVGPFNRGVDVYSNSTLFPKINLRLQGTVEKEQESMPVHE